MPHFLVDKNSIKNSYIHLKDKETICHIAQSLRAKNGEVVKFIDEEENVYEAVIEEASKNEILAKIINSYKSKRKLEIALCAIICILKPDAMHLAIQNAVQLGAKEIYTVYSDNSAVKKESVLNKKEKWEKIGLEAFKQCERADIPNIYEIDTFENIFSKFKKENIIVLAEKYDNCTISSACKTLDKNDKILTVFGPEGGFSEKEFDYFKKEDLKLATLGNLILKAPNAVSVGLFGVAQNVGWINRKN